MLAAALVPARAQYARPGPASLWSENGVGNGPDGQITALMDEIEAKTARRDELVKESSGLTAGLRRADENLRRHTRALYRVSRAGRVPFGGGYQAIIRHVARVKRLKRMVTAGLARTRKIQARGDALQEEISRLTASIEKSSAQLDALRARAESTQRSSGGISYSFYDTSPGNDEGGGFREPDNRPFYGIRVVGEDPGPSFADERGSLAIPVSGEFIIRDARREESDGPGLEFLAPPGTPVRATAAGRVGYYDEHGSYGRLVILDHGDGYYTLYGGLGAVEVRVGDDLSRSARIGAIGGDSIPSALFFEVRRGTRTLPPRKWLGL